MKNETDKLIGSIIKSWIKDSEYKQKDLAVHFGVAQQVFNRQLNGASPMPPKRLTALIKLLKPSEDSIKQIVELSLLKGIQEFENSPVKEYADLIHFSSDKITKQAKEKTKDNLLNELIEDWQKMSKKQKIKMLAYAEELLENEESLSSKQEEVQDELDIYKQAAS